MLNKKIFVLTPPTSISLAVGYVCLSFENEMGTLTHFLFCWNCSLSKECLLTLFNENNLINKEGIVCALDVYALYEYLGNLFNLMK